MDFAVEKDGTKQATWLEALFSLFVKLVQVSTYILWKFKTTNNRKQNIVQVRPLTAKMKIKI